MSDGRGRVVVTSGCFEPGFRGGGPIKSVAAIVDEATTSADLMLITRDRDLGSVEPYPGLSGQWQSRGKRRIFYLNVLSPAQIVRLGRELRARPIELLYVNSFWQPIFSTVPILLAWLRLVPVQQILIAPRGEFSPGALLLKSRKKRVFLRVWRPVIDRLDVRWHATTEIEARAIKDVFPRARILLSLEPATTPRDPAAVSSQAQARFVFISRISPMKNLLAVLEALTELEASASLDIFGPIEDVGYWARCRRAMEGLPGHVAVSYRGVLPPEEVQETFSQYDAFVLPTLGENFGHVISESLSVGCPVICSDQTPWTELLRAGGGAALPEMDPHTLGAALEEWAIRSPQSRADARRAAHAAYVEWWAARVQTNIIDEALSVSRV